MSIAETSKAQQEFIDALYRVSGLVDAIFAISETNACALIAEGALSGVQKSLEREVDALLEAAAGGKIVAL
ncbi:hypothetical protein [Methylocystis hirsuta]|uniref:Uncharacterized protein n=1 Tax=Methylocystis hirsuta TaxID=369798 RepID=A0A3M9XQG2_9HYPH|nr:hypothetical protein [Methylocystis hirsuta]RNJ50274.1 hypothetical protein D1O30_12375 [Methylocystis hirsuta]